jgi:hypothetical protein
MQPERHRLIGIWLAFAASSSSKETSKAESKGGAQRNSLQRPASTCCGQRGAGGTKRAFGLVSGKGKKR